MLLCRIVLSLLFVVILFSKYTVNYSIESTELALLPSPDAMSKRISHMSYEVNIYASTKAMKFC